MKLSEFCQAFGLNAPPEDKEIRGIQDWAQRVKPGDLFIAYQGLHHHGLDFLDEALQRGALGVITDGKGSLPTNLSVPIWVLPDLRKKLLSLSLFFYGHPEKAMVFIGVTGTNGKTTTAQLIHHHLSAEEKALYIGTTDIFLGKRRLQPTHTTPPPLALASLLAQGEKEGCHYAVMEVSSHALAQGRVEGLSFHRAIFLNLQQDHLDFHQTWEAYEKAKMHLLNLLGSESVVLACSDNDFGRKIAQHHGPSTWTFGYAKDALWRIQRLRLSLKGTYFTLQGPEELYRLHTPLMGSFNVINTVAALLTVHSFSIPIKVLEKRLATFPGVPGRMEYLENDRGLDIFIDYAHTPGAMEAVLTTVRKVTGKKIIAVFGAGGDRDRGKRFPMGKVAGESADIIILTSDNPRGEDPREIVQDLLEGVKASGQRKVLTILDRQEAINKAVELANPMFAICLLGKGHETYQEIAGVRHPWSEHQACLQALEEKVYAF